MSFSLKNVGAIYQRAIQLCFTNQLHCNVEAYVDNVVVKMRNPNDFIKDLEETFANLRKFRWKLNPTKCIFGIPSGKLLGFIISNRGIEANPQKGAPSLKWGLPSTSRTLETHRLHSNTKQFHFKSGRMRSAFLQAPKRAREV